MTAEEERLIKLAIKNSLVEQKNILAPSKEIENSEESKTSSNLKQRSPLDEIEEVKTYRPTEE